MTSQSVKRWARSPATIGFTVAFVAFLVVALLQGEKPFYYDSGTYWSLGDTFSADGSFSPFDFDSSLRGYSLPLIYLLLREVGGIVTDNASLLVMAFNSAVFALIGAVLAPRLATIAWPQLHWGVARRLVLCGVILFFWRGTLSYPLSDFPALAAALLALVAISSYDSPRWMLLAGASAGLAVNARPAYLLLVPVLLVLAGWGWRERLSSTDGAGWGRAGGCLALFLIALALVWLPQSVAEHKRVGSYNPIPGGSDLVGLQYTEGLRLQRYDTYVGGGLEQARMMYRDPRGEEILAGLENESVESTGQYTGIVLDHPLTMAGVFLRHVVNGLDLRYPGGYIEQLQTGTNRIWRFAGFLLVFLAMMRIAWPTGRRTLEPARWRYPVALLLACATSIASAVEVRFMLPVFLLCAMIVVAPGWPSPLEAGPGLRRYRTLAITAVAAVVFFAIVLTIVSGATDNLHLESAA